MRYPNVEIYILVPVLISFPVLGPDFKALRFGAQKSPLGGCWLIQPGVAQTEQVYLLISA